MNFDVYFFYLIDIDIYQDQEIKDVIKDPVIEVYKKDFFRAVSRIYNNYMYIFNIEL